MKQYKVKTRYTFYGSFFINARDEAEARKYVEENCGVTLGRDIHSSLPSHNMIDWEFPIHPEVKTRKPILIGRVFNEH